MYRRLSTLSVLSVIAAAVLTACGAGSDTVDPLATEELAVTRGAPSPSVEPMLNKGRVIHVIVALCDNENQGIVPVPAHLGNGTDPKGNLYWGAAYGVRSFFTKSSDWEKSAEILNPKADILERIIFSHRTEDVLLVADAYRGDRIRAALVDYLAAVSGSLKVNVEFGERPVQIYGGADLVAFVGHNGLMDFEIAETFPSADDRKRDAIVLACASKRYFRDKLKDANANPLLWTTNLMAPEAYILHDALEGWIRNEDDDKVRFRAAKAYSKYQRISLAAAEGLLVTGWD